MNINVILMAHVLFGLVCLISALWVFVDTLHAADANLGRIRAVSLGVAVAMWIAYLIAGYWYIAFYPTDKAIILKGPWPLAHNFFMESKEHFVIMLLLLVTYLPIAAAGDLVANRGARKVVLWVSGLVFTLALAADSFGAIIAMGVKVALLPK
jgi:uncharacterized membrane protein YwaF